MGARRYTTQSPTTPNPKTTRGEHPMTPTEQDKELQELVDKFINDIAVLRPYTRVTKEAKRRLALLIAADRKRVALEARIEALQWALSDFNMPDTDTQANLQWYITELKAQQEEV